MVRRRIEYPELKKNGVSEEALEAYLNKGYVFYWNKGEIHCMKEESVGRLNSFADVDKFLLSDDFTIIRKEPLTEIEIVPPDSEYMLEHERARIRSTYLPFLTENTERKSLDELQQDISTTRSATDTQVGDNKQLEKADKDAPLR